MFKLSDVNCTWILALRSSCQNVNGKAWQHRGERTSPASDVTSGSDSGDPKGTVLCQWHPATAEAWYSLSTRRRPSHTQHVCLRTACVMVRSSCGQPGSWSFPNRKCVGSAREEISPSANQQDLEGQLQKLWADVLRERTQQLYHSLPRLSLTRWIWYWSRCETVTWPFTMCRFISFPSLRLAA